MKRRWTVGTFARGPGTGRVGRLGVWRAETTRRHIHGTQGTRRHTGHPAGPAPCIEITWLVLAWRGAVVGVLFTVPRLARTHGVGSTMYLGGLASGRRDP
jgi:hypothetical protein